MTTKGYQPPPQYLPDAKEHRRQLAQAVALVMAGKMNATAQITLTPSATSTQIIDSRIGASTWIGLSPLTADAAAAASSVYVSAQQKGQATLTHASAASADRIFSLLLIG
jgi:hypothetical protein